MNNSKQKSSLKKGIILMVICTLLTASGQILFKIASDSISLSFLSIITNLPLIGGFVLYGLASIFMILAFREGKLSTLFPMISLSFVWVFLIAIFVFNEPITLTKIISNSIIIIGIVLLGGNS